MASLGYFTPKELADRAWAIKNGLNPNDFAPDLRESYFVNLRSKGGEKVASPFSNNPFANLKPAQLGTAPPQSVIDTRVAQLKKQNKGKLPRGVNYNAPTNPSPEVPFNNPLSQYMDPSIANIYQSLISQAGQTAINPQALANSIRESKTPQLEYLQDKLITNASDVRSSLAPLFKMLSEQTSRLPKEVNAAYAPTVSDLAKAYSRLPDDMKAKYAPVISQIQRDQANLHGDLMGQYAQPTAELNRQLAQQTLQASSNQNQLTDWFKQVQDTNQAGIDRGEQQNTASMSGLSASNQGLVQALGGDPSVGAGLAAWGTLGQNALASQNKSQSDFARNMQSIIGLSGTSAKADEMGRQSQIRSDLSNKLTDLESERSRLESTGARDLAAKLQDTLFQRTQDTVLGQRQVSDAQRTVAQKIAEAILSGRGDIRDKLLTLKGQEATTIMDNKDKYGAGLADIKSQQISDPAKMLLDAAGAETQRTASVANLLSGAAMLPYQLQGAAAQGKYAEGAAANAGVTKNPAEVVGPEAASFIEGITKNLAYRGPKGDLVMHPAKAIAEIARKAKETNFGVPSGFKTWEEWAAKKVLTPRSIKRWNTLNISNPKLQWKADDPLYKPTGTKADLAKAINDSKKKKKDSTSVAEKVLSAIGGVAK